MAAPSLVGTTLQQTYTTSSSWVISLSEGLEAGETVVVTVSQTQSTRRTISSISDGTNSYAEKQAPTLSSAHTHLHFKVNVDAVAGGTDLTISWSGNTAGRVTVQRISASTDADVSDAVVVTDVNTALTMADPGVTTDGDVLLIGVGAVTGTGTLTAGTNWTILGTSTNQTHTQYRASDSAIGSADVGPWTCSVNRTWSGCLMAFYAAGGGGGGGRVRPSTLTLRGVQ